MQFNLLIARYRLGLLLFGFLSLLVGLQAGLARLGWPIPTSDAVVLAHGPLMVSSFFGTLIGLERAVALNRPWAYGAPLLTGLGGLLMIADAPAPTGAASMALGSVVFLVASASVMRRQPALFTATLALGAVCWLAGNLLWLAGSAVPALMLWWMLFLVLTIAGERLELGRLLRPSLRVRTAFACVVGLLLGAAVLSLWNEDIAWPVLGAGLLSLALWLARQDIARRTVRIPGLPRFTATCLLSGYVWLAIGGICAFAHGRGIFLYDAALHSIFLGFVFAMVFGHAPIILPAVTRLPVPFRRSFYLHLGLLHASLALRVIGDLLAGQQARLLGGLLNAVTILVFMAATAVAVRSGLRTVPRRDAPGRHGPSGDGSKAGSP